MVDGYLGYFLNHSDVHIFLRACFSAFDVPFENVIVCVDSVAEVHIAVFVDVWVVIFR